MSEEITVNNPYIPYPARIEDIRIEIKGERAIRTFRVVSDEPFEHNPGQCAMIGIPGVGESFIAISSSPTEKGHLDFSVMKMRKVTSVLHTLEPGDRIYIRGPYGNGFPVDEWKGKNLLFIGGGIGQAPLRSVYKYAIDNRDEFANITIFHGARTSNDLVYKEELMELGKRDDVGVNLSIDVEEKEWDGYVGFVPAYVKDAAPSKENTIAITCGPPIMIKFVCENLIELGFDENDIFTTLENRMKCGIGLCERCRIGHVYVCKDGPVFTLKQIREMPQEF